MDDVTSIDTLAAVAAVALVAALLVGLLPRLPIPQVVLLLAGGALIGPDGLGLGSPADVRVLADVGLGFVFLLAGYEIDLRLFREDAGRRALLSWAISFGLATGVVGVLTTAGLVEAFLPVALGLTTTALGTLLPVLREAGLLRGRLGRHLLATGGVGELLPVLVIAVFLGSQGRLSALVALGGVAVLAVALGLLRHGIREGSRLADVVRAGRNETAQITLRGTLLLLLVLVAVTDRFHLDAVLGAFLAGLVLRRWVGAAAPLLESKLDAVGYGFFVPLFFAYSGMGLDLDAIAEAPLLLALLLVLMLAVRGGPVLVLYRGVLARRERWQTALVSATALPVLVALTEIAVRSGTMTTDDAAALVGAGVLTVLVLPALVVALERRRAEPAHTPRRNPLGPTR
ncbi:cation:proton antiporter [Modestobacter versicolor]|uniref:Kef-type K+ transport system membrane component KefB n=1 Tax=Modestobacter versicolor TaxID=429133 RepID=A0A323VEF4_9ACTN|nr:cation:proton antiporter [Modestobacter versicolor]MBB3675185.1 Kef-type K+ transport system membrane component KefB [Modestobacter versicolor]PZA22999.1 sodium:proton exchanger [Modestobacter versicolor]